MAKKILIAYFSATGETERAASKIAKATGGDMFEIKPVVPYTKADLDWNDKNSRSSTEMRSLARPEIADKVENMPIYDVVFVGFPIWWYMAPTIVNGFLARYDFAGKKVVPFATSGSSDINKAEVVLQSLCSKDAEWLPGKLMNGMTLDQIDEWIASLGL